MQQDHFFCARGFGQFFPASKINLRRRLITAFLALAAPTLIALPAHAQAPNLGTAANFAVLAGSSVSNTGPTVLLGSLGISPGSAVTGFPPGIVSAPGGVFVGDAVAVQAQIDLAIGYNSAASRPATADLTGQDLGGRTLTPGVYSFSSSAQLTGSLTLNALGNPNAVFIFNIGSTLTTASAATVNMIGGGLGSNVFWRVGSSATLGSTTDFVGEILALTSITLNTGANITCGSALARNGAVTLDTNNVSIGSSLGCQVAALLPSGGTPPTNSVIAAINSAFTNAVAGNGNVVPANFPAGFLDLAALSPEIQAIVLRQLAGEASTGFAPTGIQAMNSFLSVVLNPYAGNLMADNRGGFGPAPPVVVRALGYAQDGSPAITKAPAYASIDRAMGYGFDPSRWSIWGAAYGGQSQTNGISALGTTDRSARTYGFATGVDHRILPNTIVGFALGGGGTNYGLSDGLGGGRSDMFQAAVYSSTYFGPAYVSGAIAYAWHDVTTSQYLSTAGNDNLTAHFNANNLGVRLESGYRFAFRDFSWAHEIGITPYAALQAQTFWIPTYSEAATSDFARSYNARSVNATRTEIGSWFDQSTVLSDGKILTVRGRTAWAHDDVSDPLLNVSFLSLPGSSFSVLGAASPRDLVLATAGAELKFQNGFALLAQFDGEFSDRSTQYGGTGRLRYSW